MEDIFEIGLDYETQAPQDVAVPAALCPSDEAFVRCMNDHGYVDMHIMETLSGLSVQRLIDDLRGRVIFQDPELFIDGREWNPYEGWLTRVQYLRGYDIRRKLYIAQVAEEHFPGCFSCNVDAAGDVPVLWAIVDSSIEPPWGQSIHIPID